MYGASMQVTLRNKSQYILKHEFSSLILWEKEEYFHTVIFSIGHRKNPATKLKCHTCMCMCVHVYMWLNTAILPTTAPLQYVLIAHSVFTGYHCLLNVVVWDDGERLQSMWAVRESLLPPKNQWDKKLIFGRWSLCPTLLILTWKSEVKIKDTPRCWSRKI